MSALGVLVGSHASARQAADISGWEFRSEAQSDLWFHGLAVVGFQGFSSAYLYDPGYAEWVRAEKQRLGIQPTRLDRQATRFRAAFEADSLFELFHFVPLYFAGGSPEALLEALSAVAEGRRADPSVTGGGGGFGAGIVRSVLASAGERAILADFVEALRVEWDEFLRISLEERATTTSEHLAQAQRWWDEELATSLSPYLSKLDLEAGIVVASTPLGPEGRIFRGIVAAPSDNVIAVRLEVLPTDPRALSFAVVREACFPTVSRLVEELRLAPGDRWSAERISGQAAVRCGDMLLERYSTTHAEAYRRLWLSWTGADSGSFESVFPLSDRLRSALESALR